MNSVPPQMSSVVHSRILPLLISGLGASFLMGSLVEYNREVTLGESSHFSHEVGSDRATL
eukprot:7817511-Heterocapsa_arctica.AAC.1